MNNFDKITLVSAKSLLQGTKLDNLVREGEKTNALGEAFDATKALYDYLLESDAKIDRIHELIENKKLAAAHFRNVTGLAWRL